MNAKRLWKACNPRKQKNPEGIVNTMTHQGASEISCYFASWENKTFHWLVPLSVLYRRRFQLLSALLLCYTPFLLTNSILLFSKITAK